MLDFLMQWVSDHPQFLAVAASASLFTFVGTLVLVPILVVRMRPDYFVEPDAATSFHRRHPALRAAGVLSKNLIGAALVLVGLVLLVLPGQGLLSILLGISLLDFPGKRRLERRIAMERHVRRTIDWIRVRRGHPPLVFDEDPEDPADPAPHPAIARRGGPPAS